MANQSVFQDINTMKQEIHRLGLKNLPLSDDTTGLFSPVSVGAHTLPNRFVIQPMEGCDGTAEGAPDTLTCRRYLRFAEGGAGLLWFEAVAVVDEGRANPRQLSADPKNLDAFRRLIEEVKETGLRTNGFEPLVIMQATHSGRYSKPQGTPAPLIAYNNPLFEGENPIAPERIITDDALFALEEDYGHAASFAEKAGFDGIDIKCCHRYLASELFSAYERAGAFGGSFENRTRLVRNGVKNAKAATSKNFITTCRMNVYDGFPYPYGWGVAEGGGCGIDLTEPKKLIEQLHKEQGMEMVNITIGNPYVNSHVNRPADCTAQQVGEEPLVGVDRMYDCIGQIQKAFPDLCVVGSGVSYMRQFGANLAAGAIEAGMMKLQGFGREAFAYPDMIHDLEKTGAMAGGKCCITCGKCTELMRAGGMAGCVIRDKEVYLPLYQQYCRKG